MKFCLEATLKADIQTSTVNLFAKYQNSAFRLYSHVAIPSLTVLTKGMQTGF
jgi:hypothetical protein